MRRLHAVGKLTPWLEVQCTPSLADNYFYTIKDTANSVCTFVDPADAGMCASMPCSQRVGTMRAVSADAAEASLNDADCELTSIWTTHHHWDHAGGNQALCTSFPGLEVVAPCDSSPIPMGNVTAAHETPLRMHASLPAVGKALHAGVHTAGHVMYLIQPPDGAVRAHGVAAPSALFAGDVLFPQGAGRFFEGDAGGFWRSVQHSLLPLQGSCMVFSGHDYSRGNASFAAAAGLRTVPWEGRGTLPPSVTLLGLEAGHNPFLLPMAAPVLEAVAAHCKAAQPGGGRGSAVLAAVDTLIGRRFTPTAKGSPGDRWAALQEEVHGMNADEHAAAVSIVAYLREWKNAF